MTLKNTTYELDVLARADSRPCQVKESACGAPLRCGLAGRYRRNGRTSRHVPQCHHFLLVFQGRRE